MNIMECDIIDIVEFYNKYPEHIGDIEVETRHGYYEIEWADVTAYNSQIYRIKLDSQIYIEGSPEHMIFVNNKWCKLINCAIGDIVETKNGKFAILDKEILAEKEDLYDLQVKDVKEYYANTIVSHNSTFLDALTFGLFGVAHRNINKPNLVNTINGKDCLVEVEFTIGKKSYTIRRGIKPSIFEVIEDGKLIDQDSRTKDYQRYLEENILKLNSKSFSQLVVLGSSNYVPFMQLSPADRREVVEELLDITVFSRMNVVVKEKLSFVKEELKELYRNMLSIKDKINLQKTHISKIKEKHQDTVKKNLNEIDESNGTICTLLTKIKSEEDSLLNLNSTLNSKISKQSKLKELLELSSKIEKNIKKFRDSLSFYSTNSTCPTCTQVIEETFKSNIVSEKNSKIEEYEKGLKDISVKIESIKNEISDIATIQSEIGSRNSNITHFNSQVAGLNQYISKLQKDNLLLESEMNNGDTGEKELKQFETELTAQEDKVKISEESKEYYEMALDLLKDTGIKTKIVSQYIPIMNKYINKYLLAMDAYLNFSIDENFKEVIKSRHMDILEYNSFSEGEKFRIDMSILLMFRDIARQKNSVNTNILILDEVFDSSLDNAGTEQFLRLLRDLSKKIHIFAVSHKSDLTEKFNRSIKIEKKNNFSSIVE